MLAAVFLKGFREAIGLASAAAVPYLLLNLVVLGRGALEITRTRSCSPPGDGARARGELECPLLIAARCSCSRSSRWA